MKRPDIDVEICPPGTMALLESLEWEWDGNWCHVCENHRSEGHRADCKLSAILTAHRAQPVVSRESRQATQPPQSAEGKPREFDADGGLVLPEGYETVTEWRPGTLFAAIDPYFNDDWESTSSVSVTHQYFHIAPEAQP